MTFAMSFTGPTSPPTPSLPSASLADDYPTLVMDACSLLAESDCRFHVEGFRDPGWPVDITYDFSSVMEQLPDLLTAVRSGSPAELDFYGQGIERLLEVSRNGDQVTITCVSGTSWVPDPATEYIAAAELETMLTSLAREFARAATKVDPRLATLTPFAEWASGEI